VSRAAAALVGAQAGVRVVHATSECATLAETRFGIDAAQVLPSRARPIDGIVTA